MAVFPTAYFGSIAYFQQLLCFSAVEIEVWDTFPKQTFRNRCTILTPQGEQLLTLPVEKPDGSKTLTKDILVSDKQQDWRTNHWRAIRSNYASAPYFEHYASDIEELIYTREPNLVSYNSLITKKIAALFDCEIDLSLTSGFQLPGELRGDFRNVNFDNPSPDKYTITSYTQVLFEELRFYPNPSILDLLFCEGPMGRKKLIFEKK
jgi:hypothetical protein